MNRRSNSRKWKLAVKIALASVLALDLALAVISWRIASAAPQAQTQRLTRLARTAQLLAADVHKGRQIETRIPDLKSECDDFYAKDLLPSSSGYASIIADIGQMARQAGVQAGGLSFREKSVKDRSLKAVQISTAVQGDYASLIRLLDEIQRSPHFYLLDELLLTSAKSGMVSLRITLRTYFRT